MITISIYNINSIAYATNLNIISTISTNKARGQKKIQQQNKIKTFSCAAYNLKNFKNNNEGVLKKDFHTYNVLYYPQVASTNPTAPAPVLETQTSTTQTSNTAEADTVSVRELETRIKLLNLDNPPSGSHVVSHTSAGVETQTTVAVDPTQTSIDVTSEQKKALLNNSEEDKTSMIGDTAAISSYKESFPWFYDKSGNLINYNKNIGDISEAIEYLSIFLETKYVYKMDEVSTKYVIKILNEFKDHSLNNEGITVLEFYNIIAKEIASGKFKEDVLKKVITNSVENETLSQIKPHTKPLGEWGDMSALRAVNELYVKIKNLEINTIVSGANLTIHVVPAVVNVFSYGLILRTYMKLIYNRPYPTNIPSTELAAHKLLRNHNLAVFSLIGVPAIIMILRKSSLGLKDMVSIDISSGSSNAPNELEESENKIYKSAQRSGLFLILSNLNKTINQILPNWFK